MFRSKTFLVEKCFDRKNSRSKILSTEKIVDRQVFRPMFFSVDHFLGRNWVNSENWYMGKVDHERRDFAGEVDLGVVRKVELMHFVELLHRDHGSGLSSHDTGGALVAAIPKLRTPLHTTYNAVKNIDHKTE